MNTIEDLVRERVGLDPRSIGANVIERAVRLQMKRLGLKTTEQHCQLLQHSPADWRELVESLMVTETWFFRDREAFTALARLVQDHWLPAHPEGRLHLLSLPCSSGEEPFSIAMALLDAGVPAERFIINSADLSTRALAQAELGVYRKNSFRGEDLEFRRRYFHKSKEGFVMDSLVRGRTRFAQTNVLTQPVPFGNEVYDFIFCRNMLIYLDSAAQKVVLEKMAGLLGPAGTLFVGPAELPLAVRHGFLSAQLPKAFACRKPSGHAAHLHRPPDNLPAPAGVRTGVVLSPALDGGELERSVAMQVELQQAQKLADTGYLAEAAGICEAHLRRNGPSADAYYLLGLVRDARGEMQAIECYRKALYLEPNHREALLQMSLLAQRNGDASAARNFRRRAERTRTCG
jgi:chemotaxis protein methyltransferase WspC